jgi:LPXTG-site transpeptidase (sortase) family protein
MAMREFVKLNRKLMLAAFAAGVLAAAISNLPWKNLIGSSNATNLQSSASVAVPKTSYTYEENAPPARLVIPSIQVDAAVQSVGVTGDGTMDVAHSYSDVGWYKYGPFPGAPGNAVIEGHLDTAISPYAVFFKLDKLVPGDDVEIIDSLGRTVKFKVTAVKSYAYDASTADVFGSSDTSHLNLVTCDGKWIKAKKLYDGRLVVFTERVN